MATTTKPQRTKEQAPSPPPAAPPAQPERPRFEDIPGYDPERGAYVHQDSGKRALELVNEAARRRGQSA